jgi:hypothetical protein
LGSATVVGSAIPKGQRATKTKRGKEVWPLGVIDHPQGLNPLHFILFYFILFFFPKEPPIFFLFFF